jgi:hypothetical protein
MFGRQQTQCVVSCVKFDSNPQFDGVLWQSCQVTGGAAFGRVLAYVMYKKLPQDKGLSDIHGQQLTLSTMLCKLHCLYQPKRWIADGTLSLRTADHNSSPCVRGGR